MPPTIVTTPGSASANSYITVAEANAYFESRLPLDPPWDATESIVIPRILTAARMLTSVFAGSKRLVTPKNGDPYYLIGFKWTGLPADAIQVMDWPRIGMYDRLGRELSSSIIPSELKQAQSELAGQLSLNDRTLDNDILTQGIQEIGAGPVKIKFREDLESFTETALVLPAGVLSMLVPSWYTGETMEKGPDLRRINRPRIASMNCPRWR